MTDLNFKLAGLIELFVSFILGSFTFIFIIPLFSSITNTKFLMFYDANIFFKILDNFCNKIPFLIEKTQLDYTDVTNTDVRFILIITSILVCLFNVITILFLHKNIASVILPKVVYSKDLIKELILCILFVVCVEIGWRSVERSSFLPIYFFWLYFVLIGIDLATRIFLNKSIFDWSNFSTKKEPLPSN